VPIPNQTKGGGHMKMVLAFVLAILVFLPTASLGLAEAGRNKHLEEQTESFPIDLPDMQTEAGIREYLAGEWYYYDPAYLGYNSCLMVIDEDLDAEFEFRDNLTNEVKGHY